ncbi:MAG: redox-sensing transcriptional repressor Rex, partial [Chloroflexi bacterium]|nr:redox-sensing transcriptional repressor Rex [Chloroflexota bacterium]
MDIFPSIPLPSLRRLPIYYRRLRAALEEGKTVLSSQELGDAA